jgi:hypothetical protein
MSPINDNKRKWQVKNISNQTIVIGDLDKVPSLPPNASHNLLRYATEEEIKESTILANLIRNGTLTLRTENSPTSDIDNL